MTYVEVKFGDGRVEHGTSAFVCWTWDGDSPAGHEVAEWREISKPPTKEAIIADLLEALTRISSEVRLCGYAEQTGFEVWLSMADAAIAKARGAA